MVLELLVLVGEVFADGFFFVGFVEEFVDFGDVDACGAGGAVVAVGAVALACLGGVGVCECGVVVFFLLGGVEVVEVGEEFLVVVGAADGGGYAWLGECVADALYGCEGDFEG